ncbi:MAG: hypothetical protein SF053_21165 [Bacteroidia bacterium]|nr:hypothetical protein [Bacteroidia bacterium]
MPRPATPPADTPNPEEELRQLFPLARTWRQMYLFVLGELALTILLLYLFSQAFI